MILVLCWLIRMLSCLVVIPTYCLWHFVHVIRYTTCDVLHVKVCRIGNVICVFVHLNELLQIRWVVQVAHLLFWHGMTALVARCNFGRLICSVWEGGFRARLMSISCSSDGVIFAFTSSCPSVLCLLCMNFGLGTVFCISMYWSKMITFNWLKWGGGRQLKMGVFGNALVGCVWRSCWRWLNLTIAVYLFTNVAG